MRCRCTSQGRVLKAERSQKGSAIRTLLLRTQFDALSIYLQRSDFTGYLLASPVTGSDPFSVVRYSLRFSLDKVSTGLPNAFGSVGKLWNNSTRDQDLPDRRVELLIYYLPIVDRTHWHCVPHPSMAPPIIFLLDGNRFKNVGNGVHRDVWWHFPKEHETRKSS